MQKRPATNNASVVQIPHLALFTDLYTNSWFKFNSSQTYPEDFTLNRTPNR